MQATLMLPNDMQRANEHRFAKKHIDGYIRRFMEADPEIMAAVQEGVDLLSEWAQTEFSYESKRIRANALKAMDLNALVMDIIVGTVYCQVPEMFTTFTAMMAGKLGFADKLESITAVAEILAVLCETDLFDLNKHYKFDSIKIQSNISLSLEIEEYINNCTYLPPLVCVPKVLKHNKDTPYLTIGPDSLILNHGHHNEDICLDSINRKNATALTLNVEFLCRVEEEPNTELDTPEKVVSWGSMKKQSYEFYELMVKQGNKFYLHNKYDKRGRMYASGYHISSQGSPFKKAMIELHRKDVVEGVPDEFRF